MENREYTNYYRNLYNDWSIPQQHIDYLHKIGETYTPTVVYDIGSAVLHWTKEAKKVWPNASYYNFEAVLQVEEFYREMNANYALGVFSDVDGKHLTFYNHPLYLGGNSYYKENVEFSPAAKDIYNEASEEQRTTYTIDTAVDLKEFPLPDLIKIDVQGAEMDILKGMPYSLSKAKHLILELGIVDYNIGAPKHKEVIEYVENLGFKLVTQPNGEWYFCGNGPDADAHFIKR